MFCPLRPTDLRVHTQPREYTNMKNYYQILGIEPKATEDDIRRAYRRMALQYHPDRNPGDPKSEDRFKEVNEAYGVLIDQDKRRDFDLWRDRSENIRTANQGAYTYARNETFKYTQEEIFRDLFRDRRNTGVFRDLFREFEKAGFRFDKRFLDHVLFAEGASSSEAYSLGEVSTRPGPGTVNRRKIHRTQNP